jgi:hypothetical protein
VDRQADDAGSNRNPPQESTEEYLAGKAPVVGAGRGGAHQSVEHECVTWPLPNGRLTMVGGRAWVDARSGSRDASMRVPPNHPESQMTASPFSQSDQTQRPRGTAAAVSIGMIAIVAVLGLFTAGVTFLGLAIGFPIAGTVAAEYHVLVSPTDLALAEQLAGYWWLFGVLAVASVGAAVLVAVKAIEHLSPTPRD